MKWLTLISLLLSASIGQSTSLYKRDDVEHAPIKNESPEVVCKLFKEDPKNLIEWFMHESARRHSDLVPAAILGFGQKYKHINTECCEADEKENCFITKMTRLTKTIHGLESKQKLACQILEDFPKKSLLAKNLAQISQKFPNATIKIASNLAQELTHMYEDCCHGDKMECMIERLELTNHVCEHEKELTPNLHKCCEKPVLERSPCIVLMPNQEIPADLSKHVPEFIEDPNICQHFNHDRLGLTGRFLYEYSRRHQELSVEILLMIAKGYDDLLEKCCKTDNPPECYKDANVVLANEIKASKTLLEQLCVAQTTLGNYLFQNVLIVKYARRMPQIPVECLIDMTKKMVQIGEECCGQPEDQRIPCADAGLAVVYAELCEKQKKNYINQQVAHCCSESYSGRRSCFSSLGVDETYVPPPITEDTFHFDAKICTATQEKQQSMKQRFLAKLIKLRPKAEQKNVDECTADFLKMVQKCCPGEEPQKCFDDEEKELIKHCQEHLSE
ncbi:hypothetical protein GDO86_000746 [Hymenochirus boettgeri]|uniref:Albumin domain-containing protein n=1 Tax=Hymenochirus boettgeri TaxID=247094 RepID=A0A8T2KCV9_9PIPI|nr:hypothetical protein GDO86_000746 [Hymenochirus boettgeri]